MRTFKKIIFISCVVYLYEKKDYWHFIFRVIIRLYNLFTNCSQKSESIEPKSLREGIGLLSTFDL